MVSVDVKNHWNENAETLKAQLCESRDGSQSQTVLIASVDEKQEWNENAENLRAEELCEGRGGRP